MGWELCNALRCGLRSRIRPTLIPLSSRPTRRQADSEVKNPQAFFGILRAPLQQISNTLEQDLREDHSPFPLPLHCCWSAVCPHLDDHHGQYRPTTVWTDLGPTDLHRVRSVRTSCGGSRSTGCAATSRTSRWSSRRFCRSGAFGAQTFKKPVKGCSRTFGEGGTGLGLEGPTFRL